MISGLKARLNGIRAEKSARNYLIKQGLTFCEANYHCKWGEIDLIFRHAEQWVFVEVKSRASSEFGTAEEFYTPGKRKKLHKAIMHWLSSQGLNPEITNFRIDLVAINDDKVDWYQCVE
ncbi:YraN family protein [Planctobacterium marinum]|uniref:YraN family protein n=1 Tax=Planctobacterium marinum TaxID=1631968 RepID=UPI001E39981C|nr:YraN family protein [Planctobacterium marinum]MCC2604896.1 YraN family protein [Planctobacterium marinum]